MSRLRRDPREPCLQRREFSKVEAALLGNMGIGIKADVGDGEAAPSEPLVLLEMVVH